METHCNWQEEYDDVLATPEQAVRNIKPGHRVFVGTGCAQPEALVKALADRGRSHGLEPEPPDRLVALEELHDLPKDELSFPPGVTGVDHFGDIFAVEELLQHP